MREGYRIMREGSWLVFSSRSLKEMGSSLNLTGSGLNVWWVCYVLIAEQRTNMYNPKKIRKV